MKKWWIWVLCTILLLAVGIPVGRSYLARREKAKRQKELWEKMKTETQTEEPESLEPVDPSSVEGYVDAKELAALEEACDYDHYQVNEAGQTYGTFHMAHVLFVREIDAATEKFKAEHPDVYEELLAAIEVKIKEGIWDEQKDWKLGQLGLDGYDASRKADVSYYFNWDESSTEPDRHFRVNLPPESYLAMLPDLINVEDSSYSLEPSAKSAFSAVSERWQPVTGYVKKDDYWSYYNASIEQMKQMILTTYANDGETALQKIRQRQWVEPDVW